MRLAVVLCVTLGAALSCRPAPSVEVTVGPGTDAAATTVTAVATTAASAPARSGPPATIDVHTVDEIRDALASARPGDIIRVADGDYQFRPRLVASAPGTASAPITLQGTGAAVLGTKNARGDYGLYITGDYWRIEGLTVAHGSKGIVLDGSIGSVIDGVEVFNIGAEGVHFRSCSSHGVLRNSYVHDTGRTDPQYGEGVYVGSANSHWTNFTCRDVHEQQSAGDNTERVLIEGNTFEDIPAEGADGRRRALLRHRARQHLPPGGSVR